MCLKNIPITAFLLFFTLILFSNLPTAKAGGCQETFFLSHNNKDTTWTDNFVSNISDSLTITNTTDTAILKFNFACQDDGPESVTCYWYKDGILLKTDNFIGTSNHIDGIDSIKITEGGIYTVEIPVLDRTFTLTVFDNGSPNAVINHNAPASGINIYPNPVNDELTLNLNFSSPTQINYSIYNTLGQAIKSGDVSVTDNEKYLLNMSDLSAGMYFLIVRYNNNQQAKMFVKN